MPMKCAMFGKGEIRNINPESDRPIYIAFANDSSNVYSADGKLFQVVSPTLKLLNIPFTEGMEVECDIYGSGAVAQVVQGLHENNKIIIVLFDNGTGKRYTFDGRIDNDANQTLFPKYEI